MQFSELGLSMFMFIILCYVYYTKNVSITKIYQTNILYWLFPTGIGDLLTLPDGSRNLMPPSDGKPYFITTQPLSSLLRDLRDKKYLLG